MSVEVYTDGDNIARLECGRALVEFSKDGDSPSCPNSWTWGFWFDGDCILGTSEENALSLAVDDATNEIGRACGELAALVEYLIAYGAFGKVVE